MSGHDAEINRDKGGLPWMWVDFEPSQIAIAPHVKLLKGAINFLAETKGGPLEFVLPEAAPASLIAGIPIPGIACGTPRVYCRVFIELMIGKVAINLMKRHTELVYRKFLDKPPSNHLHEFFTWRHSADTIWLQASRDGGELRFRLRLCQFLVRSG